MELTIGLETNLNWNAERGRTYKICSSGHRSETKVQICHICKSLHAESLGIFSYSCRSFLEMCDSLPINTNEISILSFLHIAYYLFIPPITSFVVGTKNGLTQNYSSFNKNCTQLYMNFLLFIFILQTQARQLQITC